MSIRPEFLIRGADGRPLPPDDLMQRLKRYDPRIGLFYTKASWAITEAWKDDDPRRQWIRSGEMQPEFAFDICGYLPPTCGLDEAPAYIEQQLRYYTPEQFTGLREAVNNWNSAQQDAVLENAVLGGVSNALDKSNDVSPGISAPVGIALTASSAVAVAPAPTKVKKSKAGG